MGLSSLLSSSTTGTHGFHQRTPGLPSSPTMLNVWSVTSTVVINVVATMMKTIFPMVVQLTVNDVRPMTMFSVMTVKTQLLEPNKSPLVSANGLNDTSQPVLVKRTTFIKSTV